MASPTLAPDVKLVRAVEVDMEARKIESANRKNFVKLGQLMLECEEKELWRELKNTQKDSPSFGRKFNTFDEWVIDAVPASRASGYEAKRAVMRLLESHIDPETAQDVPRVNLNLLTTKLPTSARPDFMEPARRMTEKELRKTIQVKRPDLHVEDVERMKLKFDQSQFKKITVGLEIAEWVQGEGPCRKEDLLEFVVQEFLFADCEVNGYEGMSNEEAYKKSRR